MVCAVCDFLEAISGHYAGGVGRKQPLISILMNLGAYRTILMPAPGYMVVWWIAWLVMIIVGNFEKRIH